VPPSYAIITDTYPPGKRAAALGIFNLGPPIGARLGVAFGARSRAAFGWRIPFIAVGVIGIVTALAVWLTVREPTRGATDAGMRPRARPVTQGRLLADGAHVLQASGADARALGSGATQFVTYGLGNFAVLFLMREKGMELGEIAIWYALVLLHRHGRRHGRLGPR
jgi:MFS family permease